MLNQEERNKIKYIALKWYCHDVVNGLPLRWVEPAFNKMVTEKQDSPTERIKELIDLIIDETEKALKN